MNLLPLGLFSRKIFFMRTVIIILFLSFSVTTLKSQFVIDGQFRTRGMINHGFMIIPPADSDAAFHVEQRTRLNLRYKRDILETRISVQDIRVWGDDNNYLPSGPIGNTNSISVFESWVKINATKSLSFKVGRQIWNYDDGRMLSDRNWLNTALSYDAMLVSFKTENSEIDAGFSYNSNEERLLGNDYRNIIGFETDENGSFIPIFDAHKLKTINFLYYKYNFTPDIYLSYVNILSGAQKFDSDNVLYMKGTFGLNLFYKTNYTSGHLSGFYQTGKSQSGKDVSSYMLSAATAYLLPNKKIAIKIGADLFSGNDVTNPDIDFSITDHTFDLLYGARYKFYGYMNHFTLMDRHTRNAGLINPYIKTDYRFSPKDRLELSFHLFQLFRDVKIPNSQDFYDKHLSSEINLVYGRRISDEINLRVGAAYSLPSETLEVFKGLNSGNAGQTYAIYTMLIVRPKFFDSRNQISN